MGKLRVLSGVEVCAILASAGFEEVRQRGSHVVMRKRTEESTTSVPIPQHKELRTGTLLGIIRQSGVSRALFEE